MSDDLALMQDMLFPEMGRPDEVSNVYVLDGVDGCCKIGRANSVSHRVRELQTGHPKHLRVHFVVEVPASLASPIETGAHALLQRSRRKGEWFAVSPDLAQNAVIESASRFIDVSNRQAALACTLADEYKDRRERMYYLRKELREVIGELDARGSGLIAAINEHMTAMNELEQRFKESGAPPALWSNMLGGLAAVVEDFGVESLHATSDRLYRAENPWKAEIERAALCEARELEDRKLIDQAGPTP